MAVKVLDVGGEVLAQNDGACNQDFLMINQPVFAFANEEDYLWLDRIRRRTTKPRWGSLRPCGLRIPRSLHQHESGFSSECRRVGVGARRIRVTRADAGEVVR